MQGLDGDLGHSDGVVVGVGDIQDILGRKARRGCRWPSLQKADPSQVPGFPEYLPWHQDRELMKTNVRKFLLGGLCFLLWFWGHTQLYSGSTPPGSGITFWQCYREPYLASQQKQAG